MDDKLQVKITEAQRNPGETNDLRMLSTKEEFIKVTQSTKDQRCQQDVKVRINPQSQIRKLGGRENSSTKYSNLKINEEESMEEQKIFEVVDMLNEKLSTSKFVKAKLDMAKKKRVKMKSRC